MIFLIDNTVCIFQFEYMNTKLRFGIFSSNTFYMENFMFHFLWYSCSGLENTKIIDEWRWLVDTEFLILSHSASIDIIKMSMERFIKILENIHLNSFYYSTILPCLSITLWLLDRLFIWLDFCLEATIEILAQTNYQFFISAFRSFNIMLFTLTVFGFCE